MLKGFTNTTNELSLSLESKHQVFVAHSNFWQYLSAESNKHLGTYKQNLPVSIKDVKKKGSLPHSPEQYLPFNPLE